MTWQWQSRSVMTLAAGRPVVGDTWLTASSNSTAFVSAENHLVQDKKFESSQKFNLKTTLERARAAPVLKDVRVHVLPPRVRPARYHSPRHPHAFRTLVHHRVRLSVKGTCPFNPRNRGSIHS